MENIENAYWYFPEENSVSTFTFALSLPFKNSSAIRIWLSHLIPALWLSHLPSLEII